MNRSKNTLKDRRIARVRKHLKMRSDRPRLSVNKSNKYIYAQIIDDAKGKTLVSASSAKSTKKGLEAAKEVGIEIAKKAKEIKLSSVVFDRGSFKYHGRIKALADSARENGLDF